MQIKLRVCLNINYERRMLFIKQCRQFITIQHILFKNSLSFLVKFLLFGGGDVFVFLVVSNLIIIIRVSLLLFLNSLRASRM